MIFKLLFIIENYFLKDENNQKILKSGQSNVPIEDKTLSIYYGNDFANIKCINFVSMAHSGNKVAKVSQIIELNYFY